MRTEHIVCVCAQKHLYQGAVDHAEVLEKDHIGVHIARCDGISQRGRPAHTNHPVHGVS
jgi:hypothetical protein